MQPCAAAAVGGGRAIARHNAVLCAQLADDAGRHLCGGAVRCGAVRCGAARRRREMLAASNVTNQCRSAIKQCCGRSPQRRLRERPTRAPPGCAAATGVTRTVPTPECGYLFFGACRRRPPMGPAGVAGAAAGKSARRRKKKPNSAGRDCEYMMTACPMAAEANTSLVFHSTWSAYGSSRASSGLCVDLCRDTCVDECTHCEVIVQRPYSHRAA